MRTRCFDLDLLDQNYISLEMGSLEARLTVAKRSVWSSSDCRSFKNRKIVLGSRYPRDDGIKCETEHFTESQRFCFQK